MEIQFEWDMEKARANLAKHGVGFAEAATIFKDRRMLSLYDEEHSLGEDRWLTMGISDKGRLLIVCHTYHQCSADTTTVRIFSSRKANGNEANQYKG